MNIEHLALQVEDPAAMGEWLIQHLRMRVRRAGDPPVSVRFIVDEGGRTMLELYRNQTAPLPDYRNMDPALLHVAFASEDIEADCDKLVAAGATVVAAPSTTATGDQLAMLRDPWGLPLQLVKRALPMG